MSPAVPSFVRRPDRFPRVSGDEPRAVEALGYPTLFSPRERG